MSQQDQSLMSMVLTEINWNPMTYFDSKFWFLNSDKYISQLPGMAIGFPTNWLVCVIAVLYFIRIWGPKWMTTRPAFDMKPWSICIDGMVVGGYVTAISTGAFITNLYLDCFDCNAYKYRDAIVADDIVTTINSTTDNVLSFTDTEDMSKVVVMDAAALGVKHFAYCVVYAKLFDFIIPIITVLSKKPEVSNLHLMHLTCALLGAVTIAKLHPGGIFVFATVLDGISCITLYCYLTFSAAGNDLKPGDTFKAVVYFVRMFTMALTLAHASYFISIPNCGNLELKLGLLIYSLLFLILYPYDWYNSEKERKMAFKRRFSCVEPAAFGSFTFNFSKK